MMNFFEHCADIASVGIIVDFTEDTETYIVGSPADIKAWAYSGCPRKAPTGIMWHSNKLGNLVKDIIIRQCNICKFYCIRFTIHNLSCQTLTPRNMWY